MRRGGVEDEIRHHLLETADRLVEEGWTPEAALREAERRFGDVERWRRETVAIDDEREGTMTKMMTGILHDVRFGIRAVRRAPGLSATVVATLTLGLGSALAIFSLADGILLDPIPVEGAARVVAVYQAFDESSPYSEVPYPTFLDYQEASEGFLSGLAGHSTGDMGFRFGDATDRVSAELVTGNYFAVLGVVPVLGRPLVPSDDDPDAPVVAVLSHALWQRAFLGDPDVLGRTMELNGTAVQIVGVAPAGFQGTRLEAGPEVWVPVRHMTTLVTEGLFARPFVFTTRAFGWIHMVGRLAPGAEPAQVEEALNRRALALRAELGEDSGVPMVEQPIRALPLAQAATTGRDDLVRFVGLLGGVVFLTLLVACLNAATLVSARTWSRDRELGVRQALGAGRGRLARQLLVETLVLALLGGALGLAVAAGGLRLLSSFTLPGGISVDRLDLTLDLRLAAMAVLLATVSGLAFGLGPALLRSRRDPADRLRAGQRTTTGAGGSGTALVAAQVGLSLVLMVGALLFTRTLRTALAADLGFRSDDVAALTFAFRGHGYEDTAIPVSLDAILASVRSSPLVASAAVASHVPVAPGRMVMAPIPDRLEDAGSRSGDVDGSPVGESRIHLNVVTEGFFETLRIERLEGRVLLDGDDASSEAVAVVNESAADLLWPGESPLGRTLRLMRGLEPIRVVGVVADHRAHTVADEGVPYLYLAARQQTGLGIAAGAHILARGRNDAGSALLVLREAMRTFDPALPVWDARLVDDQLDRVLMPQRLGLMLLGFLGAVALTISFVGVYGVVTFAVRRRTRELGIRIALGAGTRAVLVQAVGRAGIGVGLGLLGGLGLAALLTRFAEEWLYGVTPLDVTSFGGAALLLAGVASGAAALPARRAARIDPRQAMDPDG